MYQVSAANPEVNSAMLLASYKQHKEIRTEKHNKIDKTQREKDNSEEHKVGLQEAPHLQE